MTKEQQIQHKIESLEYSIKYLKEEKKRIEELLASVEKEHKTLKMEMIK